MESVAALLRTEIERHGPVPYHRLVELALYADSGFYGAGGGAGRRRDFITSVEVGPLFGTIVARALDQWWDDLGRPDSFVVVDAGAGPGTLARSVLRAAPTCAPALRYVLVERSARLRAQHGDGLELCPPHWSFAGSRGAADDDDAVAPPPGPTVCSLAELPAGEFTAVVIANELLDNLAFDLLEHTDGGWAEVRVARTTSGFAELLVPATQGAAELAERLAPGSPVGARVPLQHGAADWLQRALSIVSAGRLVVLDYADTTASMARRSASEWLRTYRAHDRGHDPLADLGAQDITCEVAVDQLARVRPPDLDRSQADFLREHGIDDLVDEGRRVWQERAAAPDLEAMTMRSRVREAEALLDPAGLGSFRVLEWER
ncbi:MAG: SAM-dependent methyltransferase [Acidimicrobiales bacterium]|nr:SAM-dependent methyltransferase [Acidimicrobiales bacterium]